MHLTGAPIVLNNSAGVYLALDWGDMICIMILSSSLKSQNEAVSLETVENIPEADLVMFGETESPLSFD
jgi:hypothetical protein